MTAAMVDVRPMNKTEARALTERIKSTADHLWALLLEAHERKAWKALGYERWRDYCNAEFKISARHAYRLLSQAEVLVAIEEVSGVTHGSHDLSERDARDIKPILEVVVEDIRDRIGHGEEPEEAVRTSVNAARQMVRGEPAAFSVASRLRKQPNDAVLTRALGTLTAAVIALNDCSFDAVEDASHWVKQIDETVKRLREIRKQITRG